MAEIHIEILILMFITVLVASLIAGFIMVHCCQLSGHQQIPLQNAAVPSNTTYSAQTHKQHNTFQYPNHTVTNGLTHPTINNDNVPPINMNIPATSNISNASTSTRQYQPPDSSHSLKFSNIIPKNDLKSQDGVTNINHQRVTDLSKEQYLGTKTSITSTHVLSCDQLEAISSQKNELKTKDETVQIKQTNSTKYVYNETKNKNKLKIIAVCYKLPLKCSYNKETSEWNIQWGDIRNVLANLRLLQSLSPSQYEVIFVGWPGVTPSTLEEQNNLEGELYSLKYRCYPIFLSDLQIKNCYKIYCRSILWPLFHYLIPTNDSEFGGNYEKYWQSYVSLNNLYAKKACVAATDNGINNDYESQDFIIWFHDYHLLLAPHFVRRQIPLAQIGLFVHITFPASEIFRCLPTCRQILRGILSSDLVGFHTYDYARHFLSACKRVLDLDFHTLPHGGTLAVHYLGRDVSLRIGHVSILSHDIHKKAQSERVKIIRQTLWENKLNINNKKIILGLAELDEVRGTILTIQSFHRFLLSYPEQQNNIIFILCIKTGCIALDLERSESYRNLRRPIEDETNKIKQQFNCDVMQLIDSNNLSHEELLALYTLCDVAVFGTFWDGFNTVPYEFTAAQSSYNTHNINENDVPPAVILSEFMGCMRSLCGVFRINPWNISQVSSTLHTALCMTSKERRIAHHKRFSHVMKYTLIDWAFGFINDLKKANKSARNKRVVPIGFGNNLRFIYLPNDLTNLKQCEKLLIASFKSCKYKILLFDYVGTLTNVDDSDNEKNINNSNKRDLLGITKDLQSISPKIIRNLQILSSLPHTIVAIVSGQTRENLERAFSLCPNLLICAEKGAWFKYPGQDSLWNKNPILSNMNSTYILQWQNIVLDVLKMYTERTNGSYIQIKSTALVWHYGNTDPEYGDMQATEIERYLRRIIDKHYNLVIQRYDHFRALEILPKEIHKGSASLKIINEMLKNTNDTCNNVFILSIGNDRSDEKMFEAVELTSKEINTQHVFTVRIGMIPTQAKYYLTDQSQMLWLLNTLSAASSNININNIPTPPQMKSRRSHSYSSGLSDMDVTNNELPIPPTASINSYDLVPPQYNGSFFDNVAVRSHSYNSVSKLAKLTDLNDSQQKNNNKLNDDVKIQTFNENDTTQLENEIIRNEKQYQILINDTSILEAEIIRNERLWRKYMSSLSKKYTKQSSNSNKKNEDEENCYDMHKLKEKMKQVKSKRTYKTIQNSVKYALNENELMAIIYYCDSQSACSKMKKAHRCIIKDLYWQETYYNCTNAVEKIYKVLHYKNEQFKQKNNMSQKLYHGTQEIQLNGYDNDQFLFKTITSFSVNNIIAQGFTKNTGFIFIIDKALEGLYNGDLRGANVQWLSNFAQYEYVILPTTYNNIKECHDHGLSINRMQNVYITSYFKTNKDGLKPHYDAQFNENNKQKDNNTDNNYSQQLERKYESDYNKRQCRRRDIKLCHIINCEFENADTIPCKQLDVHVFNEAEIQHVYECHPYFYLRLTTWINRTENDMTNKVQWNETPSYFMQITYFDPDLSDFHLQITTNQISNKRKKMYIKDIVEQNVNGNEIEQVVTFNKDKCLANVDIDIDEKHNGVYLLGLYENKHDYMKTIANSNTIHVRIETDDSQIPPYNTTYEPQCINLETLIFVKDDKNGKVDVYWNTPLETYGEISYKILNHINETERETISILPYSIPLYYAFLPFKVCTIASIDEKVYESSPSQSIYIYSNDHNNN